ncbi:MAG: glutamate 5-kinase [Bacteroidota bacterium]|nr:glutamate 5-kinase [Bacteroidota bacterium]
MSKSYKKVVIKVGSNVLSNESGNLDEKVIKKIAEEIVELKKQKVEVILVSSGAVASGRKIVKLNDKTDPISARQIFASVGQVKLLNTYFEYFNKNHLVCAQVLVTKEDFRDRNHYSNMKNCFEALLQNNVLPIVNENDVVSISELMFTDNDELAGLIATMMHVDALIILSNVDGIFTGNPTLPNSKRIPKIDEKSDDIGGYISDIKSDFGRGGMHTKSSIARKVSKTGITVHIANGKSENVIKSIFEDINFTVGTTFIPSKIQAGTKKKIAFAESFAKGEIFINEGAQLALTSSKATSLLPVGVIKIMGDFQKDDIVKVIGADGTIVGIGKVQYGNKKALELIGKHNQKPIIHYDYLYLNL